ncbi:MAG: PHP domain-containing protein [Candidatus Aenigmarchaeota archaeon]|nr:PHP domain-containing protein [Candidatus Aenigmarchaeota archaeon]
MPVKVDLHTHTTFSDGSLTPVDIVERAKRNGVRYLSVVDHHTEYGSAAAIEAAKGTELQVLRGVEVDVRIFGLEHHLLVYRKPEKGDFGEDFRGYLKRIRDFRSNYWKSVAQRFPELVARKLEEKINHDNDLNYGVGRYTLSQVLVENGVAENDISARVQIKQAKESLKGKTDTADYPEGFTQPYAEAIKAAKADSNIAVLAHPNRNAPPPGGNLGNVLTSAREAGVDGIEVYYPYKDDTDVGILEVGQFAERHGLLMTVGSDFHGDIIPSRVASVGIKPADVGSMDAPPDVVNRIIERFFAEQAA